MMLPLAPAPVLEQDEDATTVVPSSRLEVRPVVRVEAAATAATSVRKLTPLGNDPKQKPQKINTTKTLVKVEKTPEEDSFSPEEDSARRASWAAPERVSSASSSSTWSSTTGADNEEDSKGKGLFLPAKGLRRVSDDFSDARPPRPRATTEPFANVRLRKVENRPSPSKTRRKKRSDDDGPRLTVDEKLKRLEEEHARKDRAAKHRAAQKQEEDSGTAVEKTDRSSTNGAASSVAEDGFATVVEEHDAETVEELTVFVGDVVSVKLSNGGWTFATPAGQEASSSGWVLVQKGTEQGLVPESKLKAGVDKNNAKHIKKAGVGRGVHAIDAKNNAKYDPIAEALAQHWIEQVTGHVFRSPFGEELKNGRVLCTLINAIQPGAVPKIYNGDKSFGQMDNVANFLRAAEKLGVRDADMFETVDLFELRDLNLVVNCLFALSKASKKTAKDTFTGPYLRPAEGDADPSVVSNLKLIVAVNDYRDRNWHVQNSRQQHGEDSVDDDAVSSSETKQEEEPDVVGEAVEYRVAMLGLKERRAKDADCAARAVNRADYVPPYLVVFTSSTKSTANVEAHERRLVHLLNAKKKRYEVVYVDVAPNRKDDLRRAVLFCERADETDTSACGDVPLPALVVGGRYHGDFDTLQALEDDGKFDALVAPAEDGAGFWLLPDEWQSKSALAPQGGYQILNEGVLPV